MSEDYALSPEQVDAYLSEIRAVLKRGLQKFKIEESREPGTRPEKPVGVIHGHPHKQRHLNTSEVNWEIETFNRDGQLNARIVENDDVIICEIVGSPEACGNSEAARLIAAAPKLHRALKAILSNPGGRCTADQWRAGLDALSSVEPIQ